MNELVGGGSDGRSTEEVPPARVEYKVAPAPSVPIGPSVIVVLSPLLVKKPVSQAARVG